MRATSILLTALLSFGLLGGCDSGSKDDPGQGGLITLTLPYSGGGWFRIRLYSEPLKSDGSSEAEFDTGCLTNQATTFELTGLSEGEGRTILFEAFDASSCVDSSRIATGLRGGVTVSEDEPGRYFIPIYDEGSTTALPEGLNISSTAAVAVSFCEQDEACEDVEGAVGVCKKLPGADNTLQHWCVPTCVVDLDCTGLHVKSTCDTDTGWCMMHHPYPLNMSSARALGTAVTAANGDVVLMGGFTREGEDRLIAKDWAFERFNAVTGLFDTMIYHSPEYPAHGLAGAVHVEGDWFAYVGGARAAGVEISGSGAGLQVGLTGLADPYCEDVEASLRAEGSDCVDNLSSRILFFHGSSGAGVSSNGAITATAAPAVVKRADNSILIIGGWILNADGTDVERSSSVSSCTYNTDYEVSCSSATSMTTGRAGAAALCLGTGCEQVLVIGGNSASGAIAEILIPDDPGVTPVELTSDELPAAISWAGLCDDAIVSGSGADSGVGALSAVSVGVVDGELEVNALADEENHGANLGASIAQAADGSCFVSGGLASDAGLLSTIIHAVDGGLSPEGYSLNQGRFAAASAVVGSGPLAGSVIIAGGLAVSADGTRVQMVNGAEVLRP